jgi:hypothetical protein
MPAAEEFAAYLRYELAAAGCDDVTTRSHGGVACVFNADLIVFVYPGAVSWLTQYGRARWLPINDPPVVAARVVDLFQQAGNAAGNDEGQVAQPQRSIAQAVEGLRRRLRVDQVTTSVDASVAADGSGTAIVYARGRTDGQVAVTITDGSYRWRGHDGDWHRLPWTDDAAGVVARDIRAQIGEPS